jgi:hypothetical protein
MGFTQNTSIWGLFVLSAVKAREFETLLFCRFFKIPFDTSKQNVFFLGAV